MKQIVIISGKGGTGKTVITGAFAALAKNRVLVDCDVDAPDLHLLLEPVIKEKDEFKCGFVAQIDRTVCMQCEKCVEVCRAEAISDDFVVDPISCEGCGFCSFVCPNDSIEMVEQVSGEWYISETRFGPLIYAKLDIAEENSGKLISLLRKKATDIAEEQNLEWVLIDGPPGIGCPVIASLSGVDSALVVAEPTLSGLHDSDRVVKVAKHFNVDIKLVINKYDLNDELTGKIEQYCSDHHIPVIGKIKFDDAFVESMVNRKTVMEYTDGTTKEVLINIWKTLKAAM